MNKFFDGLDNAERSSDCLDEEAKAEVLELCEGGKPLKRL
jgi:hypothetical protein